MLVSYHSIFYSCLNCFPHPLLRFPLSSLFLSFLALVFYSSSFLAFVPLGVGLFERLLNIHPPLRTSVLLTTQRKSLGVDNSDSSEYSKARRKIARYSYLSRWLLRMAMARRRRLQRPSTLLVCQISKESYSCRRRAPQK